MAFEPVRLNGFISFDDAQYLTRNPHVSRGLSLDAVRWAFSPGYASNWHPLTWISHMIDVELFGLDPMGHHAVNLAFHLANTLLLFAALRSLTGLALPSAFAAALFGVHPLRIESVAWAAERKDVLSMFFGLASLWAYAGYARSGGIRRYALVASLFAASLMSKPSWVPLPLLLLLLDAWPLRRLTALADRRAEFHRLRELALEKLPLFAFSLGSCVLTFVVQQGAMGWLVVAPLPLRIANAFVSIQLYLRKTFWPSDLAVFYPHPQLPGGVPWSTLAIAGATLLVALLTLGALRARARPYLGVGWIWFLVSLLPVLGLVQVGSQAMADRYSYLPHIGLFVAGTWGARDLVGAAVRRWPPARGLAIAGGLALLACLVLATRGQLGHWRSSLALYERAAALTPANPTTHQNLGGAYQNAGRLEDAVAQYRATIRLVDDYAAAHHDLATALNAQGHYEEALVHFGRAVTIDPNYILAHANLGAALAEQQRYVEAIHHYRLALEAKPHDARVQNLLGVALSLSGDPEAAVRTLRQAVRGDPDSPEAHFNLANLLSSSHLDESIAHYRETLRLAPGHSRAHYNLGAALQIRGDSDGALAHFREAVRYEPSFARAHNNLGVALRRRGQLEQAILHFEEALKIDPDYTRARRNLERAQREAP